LAAWLLSGSRFSWRFYLLCAGATLLYTGGMFLNDVVDESFDRRYRPERPIVAGLITSRRVWFLTLLLLVIGEGILVGLGRPTAFFSSLLVFAIIFYDIVHKRTSLAPILMAACRFLLYFVAGSVENNVSVKSVLPQATALAFYIVGLSYIARVESTRGFRVGWSVALLFAPAVVALCYAGKPLLALLGPLIVQCGWTLWCLTSGRLPWPVLIPRGVGGLLAGIALVDCVAVAGRGFSVVFVLLFLVALLLQRVAPAT
jgi:4-hydroxybenzoate polyprenyltransferase